MEQHNKTILAPEALLIYRNLEEDIMTLSAHRSTIKNRINSPINSENGLEVIKSLGQIIEMRQQRIVDLKNFSTLTKNSNIDQYILIYSKAVDKYQNHLSPIFNNPKDHKISEEMLNDSYEFTRHTVSIIYDLKSLISDYIILK
jgi:hypothetical protein